MFTRKSFSKHSNLALAALAVLLPLLGLTSFARADQTKTDGADRLNSATQVLQAVMGAPDKSIPEEVMQGAKCVGVVPRLIKGAFVFGGKHGRGVATCRLPNGTWSAPAFFAISGGSWGLQIGVESVDLVMMIMNDNGMRHLLSNKFQVGGEASAAAGPVGRHAMAGVDWKAYTQMLTYSRSKGLFAGLSLGGSWIAQDKDSTIAMYGRDRTNADVLEGRVGVPLSARKFLATVRGSTLQAKGPAGLPAGKQQ